MAELVADYVLKRLREWGVHRIFGYPGDGINGFLGALDRADGDPDFIQARHEEKAVEHPPRIHGSVYSSVGYTRPRVIPPAGELQRAAEILNAGKKVAMLVGQGARGAADQVVEAAELLGAGVAKALLGKDVL